MSQMPNPPFFQIPPQGSSLFQATKRVHHYVLSLIRMLFWIIVGLAAIAAAIVAGTALLFGAGVILKAVGL